MHRGVVLTDKYPYEVLIELHKGTFLAVWYPYEDRLVHIRLSIYTKRRQSNKTQLRLLVIG